MEISAVYWESKIKIYGFNEFPGLSMLKVTIPTENLEDTGLSLGKLNDLDMRFHLAVAQPSNDQQTSIYLVSRGRWDDDLMTRIRKALNHKAENPLEIISPVELIFFHGPHFGDRYGIFYSALSMLGQKKIDLLVAGCSGAAVYLVLPEGGIEAARPLLSQAFEVPPTEC